MNSILRRNKADRKSVAGTTATTAAVSPASTVYHDPIDASEDRTHVMITEPTPDYNPSQQPAFPEPQHYVDNEKLTTMNTASNAAPRNSRDQDASHQRNLTAYPSSVNEDMVLGQQDADVKRSGTWARGPGTSGNREMETASGNHSRQPSLAARASIASRSISPAAETTLSKAEMKDAKRLSKIIKAEGKAEDKQFKAALKELGSLQKAQKRASAAETAATHAQVKAAREEQRAADAYLEARVRLEKAQANLKVCEERLTLTKEHAQKTTGMVRRQDDDVEAMRERKATDDRERQVKLEALKVALVQQ